MYCVAGRGSLCLIQFLHFFTPPSKSTLKQAVLHVRGGSGGGSSKPGFEVRSFLAGSFEVWTSTSNLFVLCLHSLQHGLHVLGYCSFSVPQEDAYNWCFRSRDSAIFVTVLAT